MAFSVAVTTTNKIENYTTSGDVTRRSAHLLLSGTCAQRTRVSGGSIARQSWEKYAKVVGASLGTGRIL
jgi:hypothetical protein